MARTIDHVWILDATLIARTAFSVGGLGGGLAADLTLARDGAGQTYVPGTSLAGVLRERARALLPAGGSPDDEAAEIEQLFGPRLGPHRGDEQGHASYLEVPDAPVRHRGVEVRDGVGIDRIAGAAAEQVLYSREVLPPGTRVPLCLRVAVPAIGAGNEGGAGEAAQSLLPRLTKSLASEGLRLGAGSSRGLGHFDVEVDHLLKLELSKPEHLAYWWLRRGHHDDLVAPSDARASHDDVDAARPHTWSFCIQWRPTTPLMVKAAGEAKDADMMPQVTRGHTGKGWRAVLPGSSVKGALRSHAERVLRTLSSVTLVDGQEGGQENPAPRFLDQVKVDEVLDLFGRARTSSDGPPQSMRAAISIEDCHHHQATTKHPMAWSTMAEAEFPGYRRSTRNAIDRWLGGAMDSALYTVLAPPWEGDNPWEDLVIHLDLHRHDEGARLRILALLWLVLRDLAEGWIPLGFATRRGFGEVAVQRVAVTHEGRSLGAATCAEDGLQINNDDALAGHLAAWDEAWKKVWA